MFRWEVATAIAGSILEINPFDQPNVQESKDNTNRLLNMVRDEGELPMQHPNLSNDPLSIYVEEGAKVCDDVASELERFFSQSERGDYVAIMAYLPEQPSTESHLQEIRSQLRDGLQLATTLGYGPRFLHSTGQLHKGGPNTGLFIQLTVDDPEDLPIPGQPYGMSTFKQAQALGDLESLQTHQRRVMRIHLGPDVEAGLQALSQAVSDAMFEYHSTPV